MRLSLTQNWRLDLTDENLSFQVLRTSMEWKRAWPILAQLRRDLSLSDLLARKERLESLGYTLFGLQESQDLVGIAGGAICPHVLHLRDFWLYDLVVDEPSRRRGWGRRFLQMIELHVKELGCYRICLHTSVARLDRHRFYEDHAYYDKYAFVFRKVLADDNSR